MGKNISASVKTQSGNYYIGLDPTLIETTAESNVCLAHELGHCLTDGFYNSCCPYDMRGKYEHRANKQAIKMLIPLGDLKRAFKCGIVEPWELADFFDVTEPFIRQAVEYYHSHCKLQ